MMNSILLKTLYDRRWFMLGWTLGFVGFAALMVSFFPAMHQDGALDALVENMPKAFEGLIGNLAYLKEFDTYLASQLFDIRMPLIAGIMAIILAQGLSTHEEERGELRTLLSLPISRTKLLFEKWLAFVIITGVTIVGLGIGIYVTIPVTTGAELEFLTFAKLAFMTWLLMIAFGTIAFAVGMSTGSRGLATLVSILVIIGSFILSTFGQAVEWLEPYEKLSLIHYFPAVDIVEYGIAKTNVAILVGVTSIALLAAIAVFRRRDVR
jgi:ABC-2 type transport system permease protein